MEIKRGAVRNEGPADPEYFTGEVYMSNLSKHEAPGRTGVLSVRFSPGGRTNWHTHPYGQTLVVTDGNGWVQKDGDAKQEIAPGDVVVIPAGVRHWHGATDTSQMTHIAIGERDEIGTAHWEEAVSDADYLG
ncbi:Cupin domain protein [Rhodobacteraceae bacterium THAF1]|uniref:(R)-mandelonitrile lyase n=1 Tax=Palleronia sp. THAF1 TaxID=2587842 RepID=UPI000F3DEC77|nr:cupin domain-containing protein [Palleronia sp. THAF1]QFU09327.1 Cupin domain protein [Palleronia sp. THAF1]VDC26766.1 Cupin domain protein [Rhodobacteraceae bacterium THAF1]